MTNEEAIHQLKINLDSMCHSDCDCAMDSYPGCRCCEDKEAFMMAIEALKKMPEYEKLKELSTLKKPIKHTNFGNDALDGKYCPHCDSMFDRTTKFCDSCGQAIDWNIVN